MSLMEGRQPRSPELLVFKDWNELVEYSETEVGAELATLVRLLDLWPPHGLLAALKAVHNFTNDDAKLMIFTVHKAKYLEIPTVLFADDFAFPSGEHGKTKIAKFLAWFGKVTGSCHLEESQDEPSTAAWGRLGDPCTFPVQVGSRKIRHEPGH